MALKIWTFLLVMSLPAAEHGHGFGSLAAVLSNIDYHPIQQNPYYDVRNDAGISNSSAQTPRRRLDDDGDDEPQPRRMGRRSAPKILSNKKKHHHNQYATASSAQGQSEDGRCMARVQTKLADMMTAASAASASSKGDRRHGVSLGYMDLSGYALHQRLRTAPGAEMYVTGMRAKVLPPRDPSTAESSFSPSGGGGGDFGDRSWARVDECRYDPTGNTLEARMRFGRPLAVSGSVRLLYGGSGGGGGGAIGPGETGCDMTLRLRPRAGLGFTAAPMTMPEKSPPNRLTATAPMTIRTTATFIDPEPADEAADPAAAYVSVHSYNCVGGAAAGHRERPLFASASTDRFEQFASAEDGPSPSTAAETEFDIDLDNDDDDKNDGFGGFSSELGDKRSSSRRPTATTSAPAAPAAPAAAPVAVTASDPAVRPHGPAGFVTMAAVPGPEPRLRRIQYHGSRPQFHYQQQHHQHFHYHPQQQQQQQQHPLLSVHGPPSSAAALNNALPSPQDHAHDHLLMEMEEVFVRGVRSLLAKHMERTLQPVLKDSLMVNMGYTVSYG